MAPSGASARPAAEVSRFGAWLVVRFPEPHRVASWAIVGGGLAQATAVVWRRVSEHELAPPVDPAVWLRARMRDEGIAGDAVGLLTSRDLDAKTEGHRDEGGVRAHAVATVGLGNALRAGDPPGPAGRIGRSPGPPLGTINVLCRVEVPLTTEALLEALAIATEAKAGAVLEAGVASGRSGLPATGTGTDCVVIAAPFLGAPDSAATPTFVPSPAIRARAHTYAGKHTALGAAIGGSVWDAVRAGVRARAVGGGQ
jgi:adenosylcobinamide amidohydrolase